MPFLDYLYSIKNKQVMKRGRPKKLETLIEEGLAMQRQFTREYTYSDGTKSIWVYDLDKNPNGPISVENVFPKNHNPYPDYRLPQNQDIPMKHRVYLHPKTLKEISYNKANKLGLA